MSSHHSSASSTHNSSYGTPSPSPKRSSSSRSLPSDLPVKIAITVAISIVIVSILIYIAGVPSIELHTKTMTTEQFLSLPNKFLIYLLTILGSAAGAYYYFRN
ncbi:hypothetical protein M9Y10_013968 [Tritrichomonas musculus]|uniref:Uncharacterized protein n=1 Tax=Tritrichomonas musculus TaxID=1915356 RepID=A0ABR2KY86_9EUKA